MRIKAITEAFSMQPAYLYIGAPFILEGGETTKLDKVQKEKVKICLDDQDQEFDHYVGYDALGRKLFQYRADTVNVHYF